MLTYFPTPYPGEWWYSVLCRYHVRSGNPKNQTTIRELFSGKTNAAIGSVLPNSTIVQIASQLPPDTLKIREIIQQHTLFSYFMRCCPVKQKEEALNRICGGHPLVITSIRMFSKLSEWKPCYCPLCVEEDRKNYGEAYWHIEHQIPLMGVCPRHGCRLRHKENISASHFAYTFFPLDSIAEESEEISMEALPWEWKLSKILHDYVTLPLDMGATTGHNNLALFLSNMGYGIIQKKSRNTILDAKKLYEDLIDFYGNELIKQIFGGETSTWTINHIGKWEMTMPERYALLQCFAGIDSSTMFSEFPIQERYREELVNLSKTGVKYNKKQLAEKLSITQSQLDILIQKYEMKPFWKKNEDEREIGGRIQFYLSKQEAMVFNRAFQESGFQYRSLYAKHCVLEEIRKKSRNRSGKVKDKTDGT